MPPRHDPAPSLPASLRGVGAQLLGMAHTRLSLAGVELAEEKDRLLRSLVLAFLGVTLLGAGLLAAGMWAVVALWDTHRLLALGVVTLAYLGAGAGLLWHVQRMLRTAPPLLSATLAELERDRRALGREGPETEPQDTQARDG